MAQPKCHGRAANKNDREEWNTRVEKFLGDDKGEEATSKNLLERVLEKKTNGQFPALVYTITHGLGLPKNKNDEKDEENRRRMQGAIVCQDYNGQEGVFSADRVPTDPFLHGSIVFTFACYGAGTPERSDFFHWLPDPRLLACRPSSDFVAALPVRMLAHPHGPLAFLGHIDPSFGLTIADPEKNLRNKNFAPRVVPFRDAVDCLLKGAPVGYAINPINMTYAQLSVSLASSEDDLRANANKAQDLAWKGELVNRWIARNDMQNFIVLGDPAVSEDEVR